MRVALITGRQRHHKQLCAALTEEHEVVGILHPHATRGGPRQKLARLRREQEAKGTAYALLRATSRWAPLLQQWDARGDYAAASALAFPTAEDSYDELDQTLVHDVDDVNAGATIDLIKRLDPDIVLCLGGPIYRQPLIDACRLMINFHAGVSPLYNGASTIDFAFANGHPHLCGGTLMVMNDVVDGGDILAHYLPSIERGDTPASLFMKTVRGAIELYGELLRDLGAGGNYVQVRQSPPLFYYRSGDWTIHHNCRVREHLTRETAGEHARPATRLPYWRGDSDAEAWEELHRTLSGLLRFG